MIFSGCKAPIASRVLHKASRMAMVSIHSTLVELVSVRVLQASLVGRDCLTRRGCYERIQHHRR